jgi:hypothetical protein
MKQLAYALPIAALICAPALAQQAPDYTTTTAPDASAQQGVQIPPYSPVRGPRAGSWEATLGGNGTSIDKFDANAIGASASLGYYITPWLPVGVRQSVLWDFGSNVTDNSAGFSRAFIDFQAPLGAFQPFIGGLIGAQYGDVDNKLIYGPEGGIKYWLNESTFMYGLFEWFAQQGEAFDNGNAAYTVGFGLNW